MPDGIVLAELATLCGGKVEVQVNDKLAAIIDDVINRPGIPGERVVTVKIKVKPKLDGHDGLNYPELSTTVSSTLPGTTMDESAILRNGQAFLSTARQTEFEDPPNVEHLDAHKQGKGSSLC